MKATIKCSQEELRKFIEVGLKDFEEGNWLDFDEVFDELEKRYSANGQIYILLEPETSRRFPNGPRHSIN